PNRPPARAADALRCQHIGTRSRRCCLGRSLLQPTHDETLLGLMLFPEPARGLSEFRRVLRPGGRAAVTVLFAHAALGCHESARAKFGVLAPATSRLCALDQNGSIGRFAEALACFLGHGGGDIRGCDVTGRADRGESRLGENSKGSRKSWLIRCGNSAVGHQLSSPCSPRIRPRREGSLIRASSVPVADVQQTTSFRYSAGRPVLRILSAIPRRRNISIERADT